MIKTPFDKMTSLSYKLHDHVDYGAKKPGSLEKYKTDFAYGDKPVEVRLTRPKLRRFLSDYKKALDSQDLSRHQRSYANALISKGNYLMKQKNFRFARAEYE